MAGTIAMALPRIARTADDVTTRCLNKVPSYLGVEWPRLPFRRIA